MAFKVKINELPSLEKEPQITTSIKENPYKANVEIEKDELVVRPDLAAIYKAKGEKHSNGGIKTYLPDNSFVISDDKSLALSKDEQEMLELKMGGPKSPSKNTPADVLKRNLDVKHYNKMTSILTNPKKDEFSKRTAAMMLGKYEEVLGRVAFAQEAKKGFPTGLPEFSQEAAPVIADSLKENIEQQPQFMKKGGYTNPYIPTMLGGGLPRPRPVQSSRQQPTKQSQNIGKTPSKLNGSEQLFSAALTGYGLTHDDMVYAPNVNNPFQFVDNIQHKKGTGTYGNDDYDINEFKTRHDWYFKNKQSWDPKNSNDVMDFQNQYNQITQKQIGEDYFGGPGFRAKDGKLGKYTYNAPNFFGKKQTTPFTGEIEKPKTGDCPCGIDRFGGCLPCDETKPTPGADPIKIAGKPAEKRELQPWEFSSWQKANMAASALDVASTRRDFAYRSQVKSPLLEVQMNNPQRMMNNIDNSVYGAMQSNRGLNPYMAAGNNASLFGKGLDIKNNLDTGNTDRANMQNQANNQTQRADAMANIGFDQQYYRESVNGRANFDNMKQTGRNRLREEVNKYAQDNQTLQYNMMTLNNPAFGYDYKKGNFYLTGKDPMNTQSQSGDINSQMQMLMLQKFQAGTLTTADAMMFRNLNRKTAKKGGKINPYKK